MSERQQVGSAITAAGTGLLGVSIPVGRPIVAVLGIAIILVGVGVLLMDLFRKRHAAEADPAEDPEFWRAVFEAAPPMFVKECVRDGDGRLRVSEEHLVENSATKLFQNPGVSAEVDDDGRETIRRDHRAGDETALANKRSCQIESCDTFGIQAAKQIVTFKRRVQVRDRHFIVGWYVPVELPDRMPSRETLTARELKHQVVFGLVEPREGYDDAHLRIGESAREAAARRTRRRKPRGAVA